MLENCDFEEKQKTSMIKTNAFKEIKETRYLKTLHFKKTEQKKRIVETMHQNN